MRYPNNYTTVKWVRDSTFIRKDEQGQITHYLGVVEDVTESRETERELDMYREHLEELVEERTKELESAQDEILKRVFDPLFTTKAKGTGLGLPIVRKIIEEYNGTVSMESESDGGTKVIFTIPATIQEFNIICYISGAQYGKIQ